MSETLVTEGTPSNPDSLVTTREHTQAQFILLEPGDYPARTGPLYQQQCTFRDVDAISASASQSPLLAVDFETKGSDYSDDISIVGIGLAWDSGSIYLDWTDLSIENRIRLIALIVEHPLVLAHNVYFDGGVLRAEQKRLNLGLRHPNWMCTYAMIAMTANESPAQQWGLKAAMTNLLGWKDSNETELDEWLVGNGWYTGNRLKETDPAALVLKYHERNVKGNRKLSPDKAEMWRAPSDILGKYCVLDAEACYLLYVNVLRPAAEKFPAMAERLSEFMYLIGLLIEQKMAGIPLDREGLATRRDQVLHESGVQMTAFLTISEVSAGVKSIEADLLLPLKGREPPRLKKDGDVSKNWLNWQERLRKAEAGELPEYRFNMNSDPQMRYLLYDLLGHKPLVLTDNGEPATSVKAFKGMGPVGTSLSEYMYLQKELGFIEGYLQMTESRPTIHPSFRCPGTVTGRLSSKEPNLQQYPKTKAMMSLAHATPGRVWVDLDFQALEPVVLTEFSQDPNLLRIYGDGVPPNDIYLYVAANIPSYRAEVLASGYDPMCPTKETLAAAKKQCKRIRSVCKTVVLACQYGAGVKKIMETLEADGTFLPFEEVAGIHKGYWDLFAKVKDFQRSLYFQWKRNHGYILNGLGRPMAVPPEYEKDMLNRFVQSTGHDILVKYVSILADTLNDRGIPWSPLIIDFHDATTVEVPEQFADITVDSFNSAMSQLNEKLLGTIRLGGTAVVGRTLADIKEPEI